MISGCFLPAFLSILRLSFLFRKLVRWLLVCLPCSKPIRGMSTPKIDTGLSHTFLRSPDSDNWATQSVHVYTDMNNWYTQSDFIIMRSWPNNNKKIPHIYGFAATWDITLGSCSALEAGHSVSQSTIISWPHSCHLELNMYNISFNSQPSANTSQNASLLNAIHM